MEALYKKLYDKYTRLKGKKESELEELNREQEAKFLKYMSAAEELIEHLRNEKGSLLEQVDDLRSELASIRSKKDEECAKYQNLLMEEVQKNKELSEEIGSLQNLQQQGLCCSSKADKSENGQPSTPGGAQIGSEDASNALARSMSRKRKRLSGPGEKGGKSTPSASVQADNTLVKLSAKETLTSEKLGNVQQPECCRRIIDSSGGDINDTVPARCLFQAFVEFLVGMKLSASTQPKGKCISALHESSGYSFTLTWVENSAGNEVELLYQLESLGTYERVAPEWMRETLIFSTSMCPIFFERVCRVIKLHP